MFRTCKLKSNPFAGVCLAEARVDTARRLLLLYRRVRSWFVRVVQVEGMAETCRWVLRPFSEMIGVDMCGCADALLAACAGLSLDFGFQTAGSLLNCCSWYLACLSAWLWQFCIRAAHAAVCLILMLFRCSETPRMVSCSGDVRVCVLIFAGEGRRLLARRVRVLHLHIHPCVCMLCVLFVFTFDCAPYSAPWAYIYFKGTGICALINATAKSTRVLGDSRWLVIRSLGKVAPCSAPARFAHLCFGDRKKPCLR